MKLEQQLAAQRQEFELQIKQFQAKLEEQQRVIIELQADKAKLTADLNPATSCVYAGAAIQWIHIPGTDAFQLPCDSTLPNKPYAIIQRRNRGIVNFDRAWHEYKNGFGDLQGEFWLGLERLHQLTKFQPHELLIQLENAVGARLFIRYTNFSIGNESESYKILTAVPQSGNNNTIEPLKFTTSDRDNDNDVDDNCAVDFASGWWFNDCYRS
ncbi:angiopoietin-related protein 7-like [Drosophila busckii]|uniref:angiopoietin-related protein 7-like n=1 Tax=Drosophila busckii TaxID=30019 RepID=UPI0014334802|nr:angiopoietin-related protein 7-like [Drosophila busckii]